MKIPCVTDSPPCFRTPWTARALPLAASIAAGLAGLAPAAHGQSFNVDVGMNLAFFAGLPDDTYGAAPGQPGEWNAFMPTATPTVLNALDGTPSGVTLRSDASSTFNVFPGVMTPGDDQKLMEDFHLTPNLNTPSTWTLEGLNDGMYELYTYASDPSLSGLQTELRVTGSPDPSQIVGAGWPGAHAQGVTFARHTVTVSGGTIEFQALAVGGALETGVLNGFQLVQTGGSGPGMNYCQAAANSTGMTATMAALGSAAAADNDLLISCSRMPALAFGFFITSQSQAFVQNPGGSLGNLCLGGSIGRFVGPGQIQNSGSAGRIAIQLDLTQQPTPGGFVAVQPGESWSFSAWFRDSSPAGPTSNFGDGYEIVFQ